MRGGRGSRGEMRRPEAEACVFVKRNLWKKREDLSCNRAWERFKNAPRVRRHVQGFARGVLWGGPLPNYPGTSGKRYSWWCFSRAWWGGFADLMGSPR